MIDTLEERARGGGRIRRFFAELRRRKVVGAAGVYVVAAFGIIQGAETAFQYLPITDADAAAAASVVFWALVAGFPIAMGLAWWLELTPPQLRRELTREQATVEEAVRRANELRSDSVAVLPFDNLSDDRENEYFSDGITDDIITSIAHIRGLRVLSRMSVMRYKAAALPIGQIAFELDAATIVTGSVRKSGSRIRIVAEVVDARSDHCLWTDSYDRELEDIFQIQSEVAASVAKAVRRELSSVDKRRIEARGTTDPEAYDLYLRGRFLWNQRSEAAVSESVRFFERALERDRAFALAHSGLADAHMILGIYGQAAPRQALVSARQAADTALSIDALLGEAITTRACVLGVFDWAWEAAEKEFERAIETAPSYATAHQWLAVNVLVPLGRFHEARQQLDLASELDPGSAAIAASRGIVSFYARDTDRAIGEFEAVFRQHPNFPLTHLFVGQCEVVRGDLDAALVSLEQATQLAEESSESLAALGHALGVAHRTGEAEAILRRLAEREERTYVSGALLAQVAIGLGRHEEALAYLERALEDRATDLIWAGVRPVYDPLRGEARFEVIMEKVGLSE